MRNPDHVSRGVVSVQVDGREQDSAELLPIAAAGTTVPVVVTLGA